MSCPTYIKTTVTKQKNTTASTNQCCYMTFSIRNKTILKNTITNQMIAKTDSTNYLHFEAGM